MPGKRFLSECCVCHPELVGIGFTRDMSLGLQKTWVQHALSKACLLLHYQILCMGYLAGLLMAKGICGGLGRGCSTMFGVELKAKEENECTAITAVEFQSACCAAKQGGRCTQHAWKLSLPVDTTAYLVYSSRMCFLTEASAAISATAILCIPSSTRSIVGNPCIRTIIRVSTGQLCSGHAHNISERWILVMHIL